MRNLKKVIALVAVFAMALTTATFAASFPDVEANSAAAEAISTLADLSILKGDENGNYNPDAVVTRAEMATIIARIQGYEGDIAASATNFTDVPSSHWASGYVALAAGQNIVNGYGDGTFGPEDPVKYEEAIKMIMVTLGYEPMAADAGGYPAGYIAAANSQRVLSGVTGGVTGQGCARSTIAQLVYNAIDTPLMIRTGYGTQSSYEVTGSGSDYARQTLMSERLDIAKLKGFVFANDVTSFKGSKDIDTSVDAKVSVTVTGNYKNTGSDKYGEITSSDPEDMDFRIGDSDAASFLGKQVIFYVREDDNNDDDVVLSMTEDRSKTNEFEFTLDLYDEFVDGTNPEIKYFKNSTDRNSTTKKVASNAYVVYNGMAAGTASDLKNYFFNSGNNFVSPDSKVGGKVTLIDTGDSSNIDVVLVEIAATAVVDRVSGNRLTFKESVGKSNYGNKLSNKTITFDEDDTEFICNITKDGKKIAYTDLKEWDVLSVIYNEDNDNVYDMRVVSNQVDGAISSSKSSKTSDDGSSYRIDGKDYDVAVGAYLDGTLKAGAAGMFYIDEYGKIAAYDKNGGTKASTSVSDNYGFVLRAASAMDHFDNESVSLKLLTNKKGVTEVELASSVKVTKDYNGEYTDNTLKFDGEKVTLAGDSSINSADKVADLLRNQLIKFGVNSNGAISSIELPIADSLTKNSGDFRFMSASNDGSYNESTQSLSAGKKYDIDENTIVFYVPSVKDHAFVVDNSTTALNITSGSADADNCGIATGADLAEMDGGMSVAVYDEELSGKGIAKVVVVFNQDGMISPSASMAVIESVSKSINDEGDNVYVVNYYMNGEAKEAKTTSAVYDSNELTTDANRGDIYKFSFDESGNITKAALQVRFANNNGNIRTKVQSTSTANTIPDILNAVPESNLEEYVYGVVTEYKSSSKAITLTDPSTGLGDSYRLKEAGVYVYDPTRKEERKLYVGDDGVFDVNEDLVNDKEYEGVYTSNSYATKLSDIPAYGMLGYAVVRIYDGSVAEVLYIAPFEYGSFALKDKEEEVNVTSVTISGDDTVVAGGTVQLSAKVLPDNATNKTVTWACETEGVTVSSTGLVTVANTVAAGDITVTATAGGKTGSKTITVTAASTPDQGGEGEGGENVDPAA